MSTKSILLGSICALALGVAAPALAGGFAGTASVDYSNVDVDSLGSANLWGGNVEGSTALTDAFSFQADGGYHKLSLRGSLSSGTGGGTGGGTTTTSTTTTSVSGDANLWNFDGSLYALVNKGGRIGASIGYNVADGDGGSTNSTTYSLFGEWWARNDLTAAGKIGGFDGDSLGSGYFGGGMVRYYYMPNLGLTGAIDHAHFGSSGDETDYTASAEYLLSDSMPVSAIGGYTYSNIAGVHANTWFLSLKYYCNGDSGATTLVDRQRASGTLGWDVGMGALVGKF